MFKLFHTIKIYSLDAETLPLGLYPAINAAAGTISRHIAIPAMVSMPGIYFPSSTNLDTHVHIIHIIS